LIWYYNDKYRQWLFLKSRGVPMPTTVPLVSENRLEQAEVELGYPMVVKNRYGAGGGSVFKVSSRKELFQYYRLSRFDFFCTSSLRKLLGVCTRREFMYSLIKLRKMAYPFLSPPLLAQEFIRTDRDIKTVVGDGGVIEAHWRLQAHRKQWKVNIDGGGIGEWSRVPEGVIQLSELLARELKASWLNVDIMPSEKGYLVTEFSPVWHHYAYKEKASFVYKDDYNIDTPLEVSLNLERIIVESLIRAVEARSSSGAPIPANE
jgi:glutathione synthase/RimK-type ligase-like ATP-grasp enzyme